MRAQRSAFSLLELLIVIGIIGLLLQLALPAVEMSREAARRAMCMNNMRQLGLGVMMHVDTHKHYPSGGWAPYWVGDPDRGTGKDQPGSWGYNILDFIEQGNLRDHGQGLTGEARLQALAEVVCIPIPVFNCPSRRLPKAYEIAVADDAKMTFDGVLLPPSKAARSDYAINTGHENDAHPPHSRGGTTPVTLAEGDDPAFPWYETHEYTGISYGRSEVRAEQVTDGLSKTYMLGEKYVPVPMYANGKHKGDDGSIFTGFDDDNGRSANFQPIRDDLDISGTMDNNLHHAAFGSAHPRVWNVVLCDGAATSYRYDIDAVVHEQLANRRDSEVVISTD